MTPEEKFDAIVKTVCTHYGIPRDLMMSLRREKPIMRARQMSMALCDSLITEWTTKEIGMRHNRKQGHAMTLYARNKVMGDTRQKEVHAHLTEVLLGEGLQR